MATLRFESDTESCGQQCDKNAPQKHFKNKYEKYIASCVNFENILSDVFFKIFSLIIKKVFKVFVVPGRYGQ